MKRKELIQIGKKRILEACSSNNDDIELSNYLEKLFKEINEIHPFGLREDVFETAAIMLYDDYELIVSLERVLFNIKEIKESRRNEIMERVKNDLNIVLSEKVEDNPLISKLIDSIDDDEDDIINNYLVLFQFLNFFGNNLYDYEHIEEIKEQFPDEVNNFVDELIETIEESKVKLYNILDRLDKNKEKECDDGKEVITIH
jgi:hypothetical protein